MRESAKITAEMLAMMTARKDPVSALAPCLVRHDPVPMLHVIFATLMAPAAPWAGSQGGHRERKDMALVSDLIRIFSYTFFSR